LHLNTKSSRGLPGDLFLAKSFHDLFWVLTLYSEVNILTKTYFYGTSVGLFLKSYFFQTIHFLEPKTGMGPIMAVTLHQLLVPENQWFWVIFTHIPWFEGIHIRCFCSTHGHYKTPKYWFHWPTGHLWKSPKTTNFLDPKTDTWSSTGSVPENWINWDKVKCSQIAVRLHKKKKKKNCSSPTVIFHTSCGPIFLKFLEKVGKKINSWYEWKFFINIEIKFCFVIFVDQKILADILLSRRSLK